MGQPQTQDTLSGDRQIESTRRIGWLLLIYLLFWVLVGSRLAVPEVSALISAELVDLLRYALVAAMLLVSRRDLRDFRIDRLAAVFFVVFGALLRIPAVPGLPNPEPTLWVFGLIALSLVVLVYRSPSTHPRWAAINWGWIGLALISAPLPIVGVAATQTLLTGSRTTIVPTAQFSGPALAYLFVYWMGHAAALEEPAFRGFLWGYLERQQLKGAHIWLLQAALFWLGHLRYLGNPFLFWVTVPLGGLLMGWLSWHSKSLAPSMVAHAAYNTLVAFL